MNLTWHIAKKDVRRLAIPVAVWLAFILAPTIAFRVVSPELHGQAASSVDLWRSGISIWLGLLEGMQWVIGYVLAGSLLLEDALVGTTAFWCTRPISRARLFGAKLVSAFVLFILAPIVLLLPIWLSAGFGVGDLADAAWELTRRFGLTTLFALMTASVARNLAQFLFFTILIAGVFVSTALLPAPLWHDAPMAVRQSREWLAWMAALATVAAALTHQFLTRKTVRTWSVVAAGLIATAIIRCAWPGEIRPDAFRRVEPRAEDRLAEIVVDPTFTSPGPQSPPTLNGNTQWHPDGFLAPVSARNFEGMAVMQGGGNWERDAGLRMLGFNDQGGPLHWQLQMVEARPSPGREGLKEFDGLLEVWSVRPHVLGEMPLRVGAELKHGATQVRILQFIVNDGRLDNIIIQERDSRAQHRANWGDPGPRPATGRERFIDRYFVVDRASKQATATSIADMGLVESRALVLRFRSLALNWSREPEGAVLVKLRFERMRSSTIPLQVRGLKSAASE